MKHVKCENCEMNRNEKRQIQNANKWRVKHEKLKKRRVDAAESGTREMHLKIRKYKCHSAKYLKSDNLKTKKSSNAKQKQIAGETDWERRLDELAPALHGPEALWCAHFAPLQTRKLFSIFMDWHFCLSKPWFCLKRIFQRLDLFLEVLCALRNSLLAAL